MPIPICQFLVLVLKIFFCLQFCVSVMCFKFGENQTKISKQWMFNKLYPKSSHKYQSLKENVVRSINLTEPQMSLFWKQQHE